MRKIARPSSTILAAMLFPLLHAAPAQATSMRTWVASNGTSNMTCDRANPCATFQQAHDATTAGGEINCVDAGDYGGALSPRLTINKAISVVCDNTQAGILHDVGGGPAAVLISAGATDIVTLKGLDINGGGPGWYGIRFDSGAALHLHTIQIRNFRAVGSGGPFIGGVLFQPINLYAELYVADSYITDNGADPSSHAGIIIRPGGTGSANAFIDRVRVENNALGVLADGSATLGVAVNAVVRDSVVAGSGGDGIRARSVASGAAASVLVDGVKVAANFGSGIKADGVAGGGAGSAMVRISNSSIANNVTGVSTANAGQLQSFKNNVISGNLADGTPIPTFPGPGGTPLQ